MAPTDIAYLIIGAAGSGVWFWYDKKKNDKHLENLQKKVETLSEAIIKHDSIHITEATSRRIAEEVCGRMEKDVVATKDIVTSMMQQVSQLASSLQTHTAVQKALQEHRKSGE